MDTGSDAFERFREEDLPPPGQSEAVYVGYLKSLRASPGFWNGGKGWVSG